jgi:glycosyltransferase involved in cell wall biosynthesis
MVTNIPAPYRIPVYENLARIPGCSLTLVYCSGSEPDRAWKLPEGSFDKVFLKERFVTVQGRFIHCNPDVWGHLKVLRPDVIITTGYNPTHLLAYAYARLHGVAHVVMTDGTFKSEATLKATHRFIRRRVFAGSRAFVGASDGAFELFDSYGIDRAKVFKSHLCANNDAFEAASGAPKQYDLLFCGRMVAVKNPHFVMDVAQALAKRLGRRVSLAYVGSGDLEAAIRERANAASDNVDVQFLGFAQQAELPARYAAARLFLFPTSWDPWGVVANEACAAGVPVLVTAEAGAAKELIQDGVNGYILPLQLEAWVDACERLLTDESLYARQAAAAKRLVQPYNYMAAAQGIWDAVRMATADQKDAA